ncbi:helix-turn-helix transcriptional regulator [Budviciaceae bacterium CWB-B4]|uniref:Helix-turn-helix transcriptional regulator n=1 Tax=Limnobaculum xujianqingii TaxID=2738837 RepID=A0A9D7AG09_9GAMM|nr:helix-turn-helix transcriptional regulator [Limnobaculum xujianqingii]MBK5072012.1 helix-turn-helix transcriptional regulator [Limnobaculum xujianqingii]MBK5175321.1 helix-turn-helix transcriptional regulator [Limnobaculum xujianqingii]
MQTLAERVAKRREQLGLSQKTLAEKIQVSQQSINKIESGQTRSPRNLDKLAEALDVSPQWLLFGDESVPIKSVDIYDSEIKASSLRVEEWESMNRDKDEFVEVSMLNVEAACGDGAMADNEHEIYALPFRRYTLRRMGVNARNARVVRVIGNSMAPMLRSGDVVGIDTANNSTIIDGDLYAIRDGNLIRVKQLIPRPDGGMIIKSFNNTDYPDEQLTRDEFEQRIHIIGRVFWSSTLW